MRRALALLAVAVATAALAEMRIPAPQGFVTDTAGILSPATRAHLTRVLEELKQKTGAEIAVLTVDTTAPLDDFTYAMQVADAWRPGRKGEDTGVLVLVPVQDRKLRILVGYGLEGILPDGLIGEIEDREMVPAFRAGRFDEGISRGVAELAGRIAASKGVSLSGVPAPRPAPTPVHLPGWVVLLLFVAVLVLLFVMMSQGGSSGRFRRGRGGFYIPGGGFPGGWGGGGGGFGGFGGGSFGGGGAGRSW